MRLAPSPQAHAAIFLARDVLDREVGRIVHRQHLEAHVAAPAPRSVPVVAVSRISTVTASGTLPLKCLWARTPDLEIRRVVHREGGNRLAVLVEEVTILGIHGHDHPLHGLETAIGHRGADVGELDREIRDECRCLPGCQADRRRSHPFTFSCSSAGRPPAVDVHLRGDGEGDVLLHHYLGVTAHGVGVDQAHIEVQAVTGIVLRQGQGQAVEIIEAAGNLMRYSPLTKSR